MQISVNICPSTRALTVKEACDMLGKMVSDGKGDMPLELTIGDGPARPVMLYKNKYVVIGR